MDETILAIIGKVTETYPEPKMIQGGHAVTKFYDCARLSPSDLARLAAQATGDLDEHDFDAVLGIAYSGILFAAAVAGGRQVNILQKDGALYGPSLLGKRVIIVDDVVATGQHLTVASGVVEKAGGSVVAYACIVDRSAGMVANGSRPLLSAWQSPIG